MATLQLYEIELGVGEEVRRAAELGMVTRIVPEAELLPTAMDTAQRLARQPAGAVQASKRLLKRSSREQVEAAVKTENQEFASRVRSADAKEAIAAFFEKRRPNFNNARPAAAAVQSSQG